MKTYMHNLNIHNSIKNKLDGFLINQRIPHLLFHGSSELEKKQLFMILLIKYIMAINQS